MRLRWLVVVADTGFEKLLFKFINSEYLTTTKSGKDRITRNQFFMLILVPLCDIIECFIIVGIYITGYIIFVIIGFIIPKFTPLLVVHFV